MRLFALAATDRAEQAVVHALSLEIQMVFVDEESEDYFKKLMVEDHRIAESAAIAYIVEKIGPIAKDIVLSNSDKMPNAALRRLLSAKRLTILLVGLSKNNKGDVTAKCLILNSLDVPAYLKKLREQQRQEMRAQPEFTRAGRFALLKRFEELGDVWNVVFLFEQSFLLNLR